MFKDFLSKTEFKKKFYFAILNNFLVMKNRTHQTGE